VAISDPSREPMLDRAMPAEAVPGSTIPEDTEAEIQLRDGTWVWAQVIGQRKDRQGHWCVGLRWYASPSVGGREGWYLLDSRYIHRPKQELLHQCTNQTGGRTALLVQAISRWQRSRPDRCRARTGPWTTWYRPGSGPHGPSVMRSGS
jgi:hypothetical protein